jgi:RNA polymerase sigma-70 factor (ECF subfamily)
VALTDPGGTGHAPDMALSTVLDGPPGPAAAAPPAPPSLVGKESSFDEVYEECVDFVWRSLRSLGVRDHRLEDAVQDVFVVVHRKLGEFEGRSTLRSWVYGIALRVARDVRRRDQRKGGLTPLDVEMADDRPDPEALVEHSRAVDELAEILDSLDADKREIFVLSEFEELTAPEIAAALGVNINTVYSRIRAARKEFERAFAEHKERRR